MAAKESKKRRQLIETGKELFLKHGIKRITIDEICSEAGVSKVTFYKYFKNKQALLKTIRDEFIELGFAKFDEINDLDIPFVQKIKQMSRWRVDFFSSIKGEFLDEVLEMDNFIKKYMTRYTEILKSAQAKGDIRKNISPHLIVLITEKMREVTLEGKWKEIFQDFADYQDQLRTILFWGLLPDKNRDIL